MSKSYKKRPYYKKLDSFFKKYHNRKIRRNKELDKYNKKVTKLGWDVCDQRFYIGKDDLTGEFKEHFEGLLRK